MNFHPLPGHWAEQRDLAQRIAAHVLGQAWFRHDGLFGLVPLPGGFGTPPVGPERERVRLGGGSLTRFADRATQLDSSRTPTSESVAIHLRSVIPTR
jgi:hypothetical protein